MKLLVLTQKVDKNDDNLGSFHEWIMEFAKHCERVTVICLQKGVYSLPENVSVLSLGKEGGVNRLKYIFYFYKFIWQSRSNYDAVFVHMNIEYVILGGLVWRFLKKRIGLWYVHRAINWKLRLAEKLTDIIFTASEKSFRLQSDKVKVVGHGINVDRFRPVNMLPKNTDILSIGRIASVKNYGSLIDAAKILNVRGLEFRIKIVGAPILESDEIYFDNLKNRVMVNNLEDKVSFIGALPHEQIAKVYSDSKIFVNFSDTGSLDKAVMEAMASGLLVLTSNEAFMDILSERYITTKDPLAIAEKLVTLMKQDVDPELRKYVVENHSLKSLIDKIAASFSSRQAARTL